jgi:hypothetical protein
VKENDPCLDISISSSEKLFNVCLRLDLRHLRRAHKPWWYSGFASDDEEEDELGKRK